MILKRKYIKKDIDDKQNNNTVENFKSIKKNDLSNSEEEILKKKKIIKDIFGKELDVRYLNEKTDDVKFIPTGIDNLDNILGGGWPRGKISLIYGMPGSGKSSILIQSISNFLEINKEKQVLYIDSESSLGSKYLTSMKIDLNRFLVYQGVIAEQVCDVIYKTCLNKVADIIVVDSIASLVALQDLQNDSVNDNTVASLSRVLSSTLKKLLDIIRESNTAVIFTTQCRSNIGSYNSGAVPTGGMTILHIASLILELKRESYIKSPSTNKISGFNAKMKCIKNRFASPYEEIILPLSFGKGLDKDMIVFNYLLFKDIIIQKGIWFYIQDKCIGQGKENALKTILNDNIIYEELIQKYKEIKLKEKNDDGNSTK